MSRNNEHLNEFIMLANIMRDTAAVLEKAYKRAITEGAPCFEDETCDHDVSRAIAGAHAVGAMADAAKEYHKYSREEAAYNWLRDMAYTISCESDLSEFKQYIRENVEEFNISALNQRWVQALTLETIQEL